MAEGESLVGALLDKIILRRWSSRLAGESFLAAESDLVEYMLE